MPVTSRVQFQRLERMKEQESFEKAFKERGESLLSQQQKGAFEEAKEAQDSMRKRKARLV